LFIFVFLFLSVELMRDMMLMWDMWDKLMMEGDVEGDREEDSEEIVEGNEVGGLVSVW
jgi:hypothetical protein